MRAPYGYRFAVLQIVYALVLVAALLALAWFSGRVAYKIYAGSR